MSIRRPVLLSSLLLLLCLSLLAAPGAAKKEKKATAKAGGKVEKKGGKKNKKTKKQKGRSSDDEMPDITDMAEVGNWMFKKLDENEDGFITRTEMEEVSADLKGKAKAERKKKDADKADKAEQAAEEMLRMGGMLFETLDLNKDDKISRYEMSAFGDADKPKSQRKKMEPEMIGVDGLSKIMAQNMAQKPENDGFKYRKQNMGKIMFQEMDENKDKRITREEFLQFRDKSVLVDGAKGSDIDPLFVGMDRDHNGIITPEEAEGYYDMMSDSINQQMREEGASFWL